MYRIFNVFIARVTTGGIFEKKVQVVLKKTLTCIIYCTSTTATSVLNSYFPTMVIMQVAARTVQLMSKLNFCIFAGQLRFLYKRDYQPESPAAKTIMFCCGTEENLQPDGERLLPTLHSV